MITSVAAELLGVSRSLISLVLSLSLCLSDRHCSLKTGVGDQEGGGVHRCSQIGGCALVNGVLWSIMARLRHGVYTYFMTVSGCELGCLKLSTCSRTHSPPKSTSTQPPPCPQGPDEREAWLVSTLRQLAADRKVGRHSGGAWPASPRAAGSPWFLFVFVWQHMHRLQWVYIC